MLKAKRWGIVVSTEIPWHVIGEEKGYRD